MSEGQRWLWRFHHANILIHDDSKQWLLDAQLPLPPSLERQPFHLMQYWQMSGQFERAVAHTPNKPAPPYVHREQINKQPPALPTYDFK